MKLLVCLLMVAFATAAPVEQDVIPVGGWESLIKPAVSRNLGIVDWFKDLGHIIPPAGGKKKSIADWLKNLGPIIPPAGGKKKSIADWLKNLGPIIPPAGGKKRLTEQDVIPVGGWESLIRPVLSRDLEQDISYNHVFPFGKDYNLSQ